MLKKQFLLQTLNINTISNRNCHKEIALSVLIELAIIQKVGLKWLPWGSDCHNLFQIMSDNILVPLLGSEGKPSLGNKSRVLILRTNIN